MKNFKELGSKKKKFLISAGGIHVITLIVILAATGLPKDGDSKADKVIQGNQDIQASDEAQTDDENKMLPKPQPMMAKTEAAAPKPRPDPVCSERIIWHRLWYERRPKQPVSQSVPFSQTCLG